MDEATAPPPAAAALPAGSAGERPLVVDVDGTLLRTDLLAESFLGLLARAPLQALALLPLLRHGRAAFKHAVAARSALDVTALPYNAELLDLLRAAHARGRPLYLASAADRRYVEAIAASLGLFQGVFASGEQANLKGEAKARALVAAFGAGGFDYAGNAASDLAVWRVAGGAIVVNAAPGLAAAARRLHGAATVLTPRKAEWRAGLRALRPHQWLKNLLVLVPAFTAHRFDAAALLAGLAGFASFSLCAASVYVLNDLLDLPSDREHPEKRFRPFAAGALEPAQGVALLLFCLAAAASVALLLPTAFLAVLAGYYLLTLLYSLELKRRAVSDVLALACLYCARLVAGGAAVGLELSHWLLLFAIFFFLCLALIKRATELSDRLARGAGNPPGRSYRLADVPLLMSLAAASGYVSVLVFALYLTSPRVAALYRSPETLSPVLLLLLFWITRTLMLTHRGAMPSDPVVFALRDRTSLLCGLAVLAVVLWSV